MDIVQMPQEDFTADREVERFEKKYQNVGIGLKLQDISYSYVSGTQVFCHAALEAWPSEIVALGRPLRRGKDYDAKAIACPSGA